MRLRALQERWQDFLEGMFGHEVGRRHSKKFVAGVSEQDGRAVVHVQDAPARRLEEHDRIGLRIQGALELRLDCLDTLLVFDVGERSDPGEDAGRASLRDSATKMPAERAVGTSPKTALRLEHLAR